jgi:hypothetical protein
MSELTGRHYGGPESKESGEKKAERILTEEAGRRRLGPDDLPGRREGDPEKFGITRALSHFEKEKEKEKGFDHRAFCKTKGK